MPVSLAYLEQCSNETGYSVATLEKVTRLGELASEIGRHPLLGSSLALKGGTALNLCFGSPTRMSIDLDYNYIGSADREQMLANRPALEDAVKKLAERLGYRVQRSAEAFAARKTYGIYRSVLGPDDRVEVDLTFLWRTPLADVTDAEMWQPGELDRPRTTVVSLEELCVGKFLAMLDRAAPRDAWDVGRLPSIAAATLSSKSFRKMFIAMSAILDHPVNSYGHKRFEDQLTPRVVEGQLFPMLAIDNKPEADELVKQAWNVLVPFLELTPPESEYVSALHRGELHPDLLFPDDETQSELVSNHPAVRWKLENVRRHLDGRRAAKKKIDNGEGA